VSTSEQPVLLLVGAGHAHLHLVRHAQELVDAGYEVHLLAPAQFRYSGLASASATGAVDPDSAVVDVAALASTRPVHHHRAHLTDLALGERRASMSDGSTLTWDVLALNVGSVADEHGMDVAADVVRVKPLTELATLRSRIEEVATPTRPARVSIVGAGPSGMELAGHLSSRTDVEVLLVEASPSPSAGLPARAQAAVVAALRCRGARVRTGVPVAEVATDRLVMTDGTQHRHDVAVLATGLVAPAWLAELGLCDPARPQAGVPVRSTLQYREEPAVYATGDCADFLPGELAKIGVYGVRQGPVLLANLVARAAGEPMREFVPQDHVLQVLDLGAGLGLAVRAGRWWLGRSALLLKRLIDHRWLAQFR
jgi:NADH dehydrogenase FAD-containing subunit